MIQSYGNPERRIRMANSRNRTINTKKTQPKPKVEKPVEKVVEEPKEEIKAVVFNCKKVRVRTSPTTAENNILTQIDAGTEVEVIDASNPGWTKVAINGIKGDAWIMSDYLQPV